MLVQYFRYMIKGIPLNVILKDGTGSHIFHLVDVIRHRMKKLYQFPNNKLLQNLTEIFLLVLDSLFLAK